MTAATRTIFLQFHAARIIAAVLLGIIIPFLAFGAGQSDYRANIFLLRCHNQSTGNLTAAFSLS
jgi:hypothetical protein